MWLVNPSYTIRLAGERVVNAANLVACAGESILRAWRHPKDGMLDVRLDARSANGARVALIRNAFVIEGAIGRFEIASRTDRYLVLDRITQRELVRIECSQGAVDELDVFLSLYMPDGFLLEATPDACNLRRVSAGGSAAAPGRAVLSVGALAVEALEAAALASPVQPVASMAV